VTFVLLAATSPPRVIVTGATGRTGSALYAKLKADPRVAEVRALVRNVTKAKAVLNCSACDASEGIYTGDVTDARSLAAAMTGVDTVAIAVGTGGNASEALMKAVEFTGVENTASALASNANGTLSSLRIVLCSSMGTTNPKPPSFEGGPVLFWKLNAEAFLGYSGIGSTIVKPCGLKEGAGGGALATSHDDKLPFGSIGFVQRADVASVMAEAVVQRSVARFLLCSKLLGKPTTDFAALLESAKWPWQ